MSEMRQDDRFKFDAKLAVLLLGWRWFYIPQWDWVGLWPPDDEQWVRYNFPEKAEPIDDPGDYKLMPAWHVGGYNVIDGPEKMGLPRFSADWRAMATLIDEMRLRGFWWQGTNFNTPDRPAHATFSTQTNVWKAQAETMPKAVSMAALDALTESGVPGEISDQTIRGRLTSIRNVALGNEDSIYQTWLKNKNTGDTTPAVLEFIAEWASAALHGDE